MNKKILGIIILLFFVLIVDTQSNSKIKSEAVLQYYTIDGFEILNEWQVQFSKFRSRKWNKKDEKPETPGRDTDKDWYDWFKAGKDAPFTVKELLPAFIARNIELLPMEKTILGLKARWDFHGYNWISIKPTNLKDAPEKRKKVFEKINKKESPYGPNNLGRYSDQIINNDSLDDQHYKNYDGGNYIILPGQTKEIALFVWGSGYDYTLEFHLEDWKGGLHKLNAGSINFKGWKKVGVTIPSYINQISTQLPRVKSLKLKRIKLILNPKERLTGTFIYLDYLHGTTDTYKKSFFGETLENSQRIWKRNKSKGTAAKEK